MHTLQGWLIIYMHARNIYTLYNQNYTVFWLTQYVFFTQNGNDIYTCCDATTCHIWPLCKIYLWMEFFCDELDYSIYWFMKPCELMYMNIPLFTALLYLLLLCIIYKVVNLRIPTNSSWASYGDDHKRIIATRYRIVTSRKALRVIVFGKETWQTPCGCVVWSTLGVSDNLSCFKQWRTACKWYGCWYVIVHVMVSIVW